VCKGTLQQVVKNSATGDFNPQSQPQFKRPTLLHFSNRLREEPTCLYFVRGIRYTIVNTADTRKAVEQGEAREQAILQKVMQITANSDTTRLQSAPVVTVGNDPLSN
jgi:hypothetical protein